MARSTLTDLFHLATRELAPLADRLLERIAAQPVAQADETPLAFSLAGIGTTPIVQVKVAMERAGITGTRFKNVT
jgi:hypothetical protein